MPSFKSSHKLDLATAIVHLRSHNICALFQTLGWRQTRQTAITLQKQRCEPVAEVSLSSDQTATVWQVELNKEGLTVELEDAIYCEIVARAHRQHEEQGMHEVALVVFVDDKRQRSLWRFGQKRSAVYIASQATELWKIRLKQLSQRPQSILLSTERAFHNFAAEHQQFTSLLSALSEGIRGMSNRLDRESYAMITLQRLILIHSMQQKGWLNGDSWYLQNRFGKLAQQERDRFFSEVLQPLYRSLSLPTVERPLSLLKKVEQVPFIERVFDTHILEEKYRKIVIENQSFEDILGWLSEQSTGDALNPFATDQIGILLSLALTQECQNADELKNLLLAESMCACSLDAFLIGKILASSTDSDDKHHENTALTLNNVLFNASVQTCRYVIQEILPSFRLLDPACGSGYLLSKINQRLVEVVSVLRGSIQQTQGNQLELWEVQLRSEAAPNLIDDVVADSNAVIEQSSTKRIEGHFNRLLDIQKGVLKRNLYGVDLSADAVEMTKFQLVLSMIAIAQHPIELSALPDLSLNILRGNSLIGFIKVDEERFDAVNNAGESSVLQGNLLQPLAAEGYQTTLAERNLALEHYKSRNQVLAAASNIPDYARAALLREEITHLNAKAQNKLNALLLNYMSQQLGIQYKAMQLADKPQRRLLTAEDIDIMQPFHWGYQFSDIIQEGGFDIVVCRPPHGGFRPTTKEFLKRFHDLAATKQISSTSFKTSKQALSKEDREVAQAWMFYQDTYTYAADYFYRSEQYAHQSPAVNGKVVRNKLEKERLFVERCLTLLAEGGVCAIALDQKLSRTEKAKTLWNYLQKTTRCKETSHIETNVLSFHKIAST